MKYIQVIDSVGQKKYGIQEGYFRNLANNYGKPALSKITKLQTIRKYKNLFLSTRFGASLGRINP